MKIECLDKIHHLRGFDLTKIQIFDNIHRICFYFLRKSAFACKLAYFLRHIDTVFVRMRSEHRTPTRMERAFDIALTSTSCALLAEKLTRRTSHLTTTLGRVSTLTLLGKDGLDRKPHRMLMRFDTENSIING